MTALEELKNLIELELGWTGWKVDRVPLAHDGWSSEKDSLQLLTQRGNIPFSTLERVLLLIPEVVREASQTVPEDRIQEAYEEGYETGHEQGFEEGYEEGQGV